MSQHQVLSAMDLGDSGELYIILRTSCQVVLLFLISTVFTVCYAKGDSVRNHDTWLADLINSNVRSALDLSTRRYEDLKSNDWRSQHVAGLDLHKVFTGKNGDIGTLVFQPYLVRLNNFRNPPFFFDDGDDWELTWRIANFNFTGVANNKLTFESVTLRFHLGSNRTLIQTAH